MRTKIKIKRELTLQQREFIKFYIKTNNACESVKLAGYKTKYPDRVGSRVLNSNCIKEALVKYREKIEKKTEITFEWKLNELKKIINDPKTDKSDMIKAIEVMNKMQGDNAPEKRENTNYNFDQNRIIEMQTMSTTYFDNFEQRLLSVRNSKEH